MNYFLYVGLLLIGSVSLFIGNHRSIQKDTDRPNIIIVFTDDQGYNDLGCFGSPDIHTPNIDRIAASGAILSNFYTAQPVCTASRVSLLTGCYPNRLGLHGALGPDSKVGIHSDETTIAERSQEEYRVESSERCVKRCFER